MGNMAGAMVGKGLVAFEGYTCFESGKKGAANKSTTYKGKINFLQNGEITGTMTQTNAKDCKNPGKFERVITGKCLAGKGFVKLNIPVTPVGEEWNGEFTAAKTFHMNVCDANGKQKVTSKGQKINVC